MAKKQNIETEGETLALIHHYGHKLATCSGGLCGATRADLIEWSDRLGQLVRAMPAKNSLYLSER